MAQTSSAFSGIPYAQYTRLYLDFWVASQSTANNQTTFGYKLVIGGVDGGSGSTQGGAYTFSNAWSASASGLTWSWSTSSHKTIREGTFVVTHNADGTLSNRTLTAAASFVTSGGTATASTSVTISVPTIPRYAAFTAFDVSINDLTATLSWTADKTISQWRWSSNSGSTYSGWTTVNASSGSTSVSVSPGSTYGFRIQVINSASGLITTSSAVSKTATRTPSTLTLSTTSQYVGAGITWTITESYDYTHEIVYYFGNTSGWILGSPGTSAPNTSSGTWTVPTALVNQIPNATSGSGTIYVHTKYGSVHVGTASYTFTAKVPNDTTWQPTIPYVEISDVVTQPGSITSYVQGKSKARVTSWSAAQGGAYISNYRVTVSGIGTYYGADITSGYLTNSGTVTVTVRATDSRGFYREKVSTIPVVAYSPPKLTFYEVERRPNNQGTDLAAGIEFSISPIDNQNTKQYRIRYRPTGGTWVSLVDSTDYYTRSITHSATGVLDVNNSYEVEFYIADSYTSVTQTRNIGTGFVLLDFNASGRGVAFGKVSEKNSLEVALPAEFNNQVAFLGGINSQSINGKSMNAVTETGFYQGYDMTNSAEQTISTFIVNKYSPDWIDQIQIVPAPVPRMYMRSLHNGTTWGPWSKMWNSGNSNPVVERGSNTNGRYIRFNDGTQICAGSVAVSSMPTAWGSIFVTGILSFTFPSSFSSSPACSLSYSKSNDSTPWIVHRDVSTTGGSCNLARPTAVEVSGTLHFIAMGGWK